MTDLVDHAHGTRVVVIGAGIAGLVAAFECARLGLAVTVVDAAPRPGGVLASVDLDGVRVDAAAEGFSGSARATRHLVGELGLSDEVVDSRADDLWSWTPSGPVPPPADTVLGIPANAWAVDVRRIIGWSGTWRAYLDRLRPPLSIGHRRSLGDVVRTRLGARVRDRLVAPRTLGVYGIAPEDVDIDAAAPGLSTALTRAGSLSGAVGQILRTPRPRWSLRGGPERIVTTLVARLGDLAAEVRGDAAVTRLDRGADSWLVHLMDGELLTADLVVVATPERAARDLLATHAALPPAASARPDPADIVLLRVAAPLPPRGAGVYGSAADPAVVRCLSAAWDEWDDELDAGEHLLRVVLPPAGAEAAGPASDAEAIERGRAAASALLGVEVPAGAVRAARRIRVDRAAPSSVIGAPDDRAAVRRAVSELTGMAIVGEWLAGSGVEQVIADATAEADRARRAALWGGSDAA